MKLKGVNPIQQHIEKIVLGLVLVILLGVIALQFVTTPNNIEDGGRSIAPAQVYTSLESQANQLQSQITDLNPALPDVQPVDLVERYNNAFENAGASRLALSSPLGDGVDIATATGTDVKEVKGIDSGPVAALDVPATSTPIAVSQWATLDPYAVQVVPEYADYIPSQQPYDFASISVEATFSGTELEAVLNGENGGSAIPRRFWSATGIAILGFEVERQRLMPDGSWSASESIQTPPHTPIPTNAISSESGLQELVTVIGDASRAIDDVARPMFPPTIAGSAWVPPSERVEMEGATESEQIRRLQRQLERARGELERLNNPQNPQTTRDPRPGGGKTSDPRTTQRPPNTTNDRNRQRIERVRETITRLETELKDLGVEDDAGAARVRTSARDVRSVLEEEAIELWAHDLGVEPGATYRYRTRVAVNNPLFRKSAELDPDDAAQQALTRDPIARGDWSSWSEPVVAGAREYFFLTSTNLGNEGDTAPARATVELYQMYYGHYRKSTLTVSPGDMLSASVRVSGDLLAFDTATVPVADAGKVVESLSNEATPGDLPEGISELPGRIRIDMGVFVLDVYQGQEQTTTGLGGQQQSVIQVVLRNADGEVIVRTEQGDESSLAYALASESASSASSTPLRAPGDQVIPPSAELFEPNEP
ncbi:MAG: hypothetical protein ACF8MF_03780 [Phycisphaerales bacterium JB052]